MALVEKRVVEAVCKAKDDLAPAEMALGKCRVAGGNHNRILKTAKTDAQFTPQSTDDDHWLDTNLHALLFHRAGKKTLLWYHFSAHAVCFADEAAGPIGRAWSRNGYGLARSWNRRFFRGTAAT